MDEMNEMPTPPDGGDVPPPGTGGPGPGGSAPTSSSADLGGSPATAPPSGGSAAWQWPAPPAPPDTGAQGQRRSHYLIALVVIVALLAGTLGAGLEAVLRNTSNVSRPNAVTSDTGLTGGKGVVARIATAVDPAVVDIRTDIANQVGVGAEQAAGTGMLISASGEVLTNNHVVADSTRILVVVPGHGTYRVKVVGEDVSQDIALLRLVGAPKGLPFVRTGDSSSVQVGTPVVAIGNSLGLGGKPAALSGTITAVGRTITASDQVSTANAETLHNLLQTNAPLVPGDSGGPLVNLKGQVIGMDTAAESAGLTGYTAGFAIPINRAVAIADLIARGRSSSQIHLGESAFLGVLVGGTYINPTNPFGFATGVTGPSGAPPGVRIDAVDAATPAARAGLQPGDTITALDGTATATNQELVAAIESHRPGALVTVTYVSASGVSQTVRVELAAVTR